MRVLNNLPPVYEYIALGNQGKTRDILVDLPTA